ncbi:TPA: type 1 fimbrial protein [Yersinia enterocolitica]|uniref:fimbrial protein n=1 Tax=Yersinia enterocolitica TaxID=630 RepID=UPI0029B5A934|nr:type 1 fimbrial protein [Yersinia enterocolitica]EMA9428246.1 type 1 fimbrial protein [Yersinia enterocolitica]HDL7804526.1 type 1 fimbrial protein [Yersinia enterocolitica]HEI6713221.1 type 1 fimbrial protein [Yersinia enterocolitica]HEI6906644.1 type 1 fimbrial protein [Yersinia enterocolitica]
MGKTLMTLALLTLPSIALAATSNNTIKFQGEVAEQTCMVDINGTANTPVVLLPTVSTSNLNQVNAVAGKTNFTINLTGCNIAIQDTKISSVFQGMNVTSAGNLGNVGTAQNVAIQLLDANGAPIRMSGGSVSVPGITLVAGSTSASQDLAAQYITEEGRATAGSVIASAQYAITYP